MSAAVSGDCSTIGALLERRPALDETNNEGESALVMAVQHEHAEAARLLVGAGARADAGDRLRLAVLEGAAGDAEEALRAGAEPDALVGDESVLFRAGAQGAVEIVRALLAHGASVELEREEDGWTPIMIAAANGRAEVVRLLATHGADVHHTASETIADGESGGAVGMLFGIAGMSVSARSDIDALHLAVVERQREAARARRRGSPRS